MFSQSPANSLVINVTSIFINNSCFLIPPHNNQSSPSLDTGQQVFPILVYGSSHPHHLHVHELGESAERIAIDFFDFYLPLSLQLNEYDHYINKLELGSLEI